MSEENGGPGPRVWPVRPQPATEPPDPWPPEPETAAPASDADPPPAGLHRSEPPRPRPWYGPDLSRVDWRAVAPVGMVVAVAGLAGVLLAVLPGPGSAGGDFSCLAAVDQLAEHAGRNSVRGASEPAGHHPVGPAQARENGEAARQGLLTSGCQASGSHGAAQTLQGHRHCLTVAAERGPATEPASQHGENQQRWKWTTRPTLG